MRRKHLSCLLTFLQDKPFGLLAHVGESVEATRLLVAKKYHISGSIWHKRRSDFNK